MKREKFKTNSMKEFSRFAHSYESYNIIQKQVAQTLIEKVTNKNYHTIVDIGCGSGSLYYQLQAQNIPMKLFIALDASKEMLDIHPESTKIIKYCKNFDADDAFDTIPTFDDTLLLSASALQWSQNIDKLFYKLSQLSSNAYFAIFTANTFKTLHKTAEIKSPIYTAETLQNTIVKYYKAQFEVKQYKLYFDTRQEMFRYIKKSGVSGGDKQLTYKEIKSLMDTYPLDYLEFEVLFVDATPFTSK